MYRRLCSIAALILPLPLIAQSHAEHDKSGVWQRQVMTPQGTFLDEPLPHSLACFTQYPALLDESGGFCDRCSSREKLELIKAAKGATAEVKLVGTIKGLKIYDVFYHFQGDSVDSKKILIRVGPNGRSVGVIKRCAL